MRKYLAYYENEWPANIAELTAIENKPFVGYLKGEGVQYTVIPEPIIGPADNEIWYRTVDNQLMPFFVSLYSKARAAENWDKNLQSDFHLLDTGDIINGRNSLNGNPVTTYTVVDHSYHEELGCCVLAFDKPFTTLLPICVANLSFGSYSWYRPSEDPNRLIAMYLPSNTGYGIPDGMFGFCENLTEIDLGNTYSINRQAINGCKSLTSINIPNSVTSIGMWAFSACKSLTSITFKGTIEEWNSITKGSKWHSSVPATYVQCSDGQVTL